MDFIALSEAGPSSQWKIKICSSKSIIRPERTSCTWAQQSGEGFASQYTLSDNIHFPNLSA